MNPDKEKPKLDSDRLRVLMSFLTKIILKAVRILKNLPE